MHKTQQIREGRLIFVADDKRPVLVAFLRSDGVAQVYIEDKWLYTAECREKWPEAKRDLLAQGYRVQWRPARPKRVAMFAKTEQWPKMWKMIDDARRKEAQAWTPSKAATP